MTKTFLSFLIVLGPLSIFGQSSLSIKDTAFTRILQNDCEDRIFTKVENIASLKISNEAYEDSLNSFLILNNAYFKNEVIFKFIITSNSQILEINKVFGNIRKEDLIKERILKFSYFWKPAVQNGRNVCSYVKLKMSMLNKRIHIEIF